MWCEVAGSMYSPDWLYVPTLQTGSLHIQYLHPNAQPTIPRNWLSHSCPDTLSRNHSGHIHHSRTYHILSNIDPYPYPYPGNKLHPQFRNKSAGLRWA